ncbi:uncharacterized protein LOC111053117 isoform X3 [Nilaparvata lugens]|uniref:uncharacterized protein LOC111053117 isoform X3 n=1 Tax=Nilaparvata lugens TaxID=108931 RepID=UPI00193DFC15|nr:uncharacterized protein LOC111053117 isoform X3 [Nilaparvata lugens]
MPHEKERKIESFIGQRNQIDVENCDKLNFSDKTFIDLYIQKLEKKICKLQSITSETRIESASQEIGEESCQKLNHRNKFSCQETKKNPDPNKLRYDESCLESGCFPDNFAYTLKARDWDAEYEQLMHKDMPPLDLPSWPDGSCEPPHSQALECQQPKCQMKLPPLKKEPRIKLNSDEVNKLLADYNSMKKCAEAPPVPPKWRTAPSYSFLYEDVPLEFTLFSKKAFDED